MKEIKLNQITQMNLIWIVYSFALLYLAVIELIKPQYSLILILIMFIFMLHKGNKVRIKMLDEYINNIGNPVKGQWEK